MHRKLKVQIWREILLDLNEKMVFEKNETYSASTTMIYVYEAFRMNESLVQQCNNAKGLHVEQQSSDFDGYEGVGEIREDSFCVDNTVATVCIRFVVLFLKHK
jgi:hypothetical protein